MVPMFSVPHGRSNEAAQSSFTIISASTMPFNLYIADIPERTSWKFGYADVWAFAVNHR